jgi:hypothetical protein
MADTLIVQLIPPISRGGEEEAGAIDCAAQWLHLSDEATPDSSHPESGQLSACCKNRLLIANGLF